ncbi:MAG: hypothetical protein J7M24_04460 [Candidatus Latescibacteria bacterium]|nr:hypothetical protein [Candidatus Latescibacterota bacterium]
MREYIVIPALALVISSCGALEQSSDGTPSENPSATVESRPDNSVPPNAIVIATALAHVISTEAVHTVSLLGEPFDGRSLFMKSLYITVGKEGAAPDIAMKLPRDAGNGYEPRMYTVDFSGDGCDDVLMTAATGGSGGIQNGLVCSFCGASPCILFTTARPAIPRYKGAFEPNWKARLTVIETGESSVIDLSGRKEWYRETGVYDDSGRLLKEVELWGGGYGWIEPVDIDGDGVFELKGIQTAKGVANVDNIAHIESILRWDGGEWEIVTVTITPVEQ